MTHVSPPHPPSLVWAVIAPSADFATAYQRGRKAFADSVGVFACGDTVPPRVGVVASRKQVGNAVARNRAKRRLRAVARRVLWPQAMPEGDYVLVATKHTNTVEFSALEKDLLATLRRLQRLRHAA